MRKIVSFITLLMLYVTLAIAQTRPITGRVVDEAGQPVSGASIVIRGSSTGTSADANGNFRINAKTGDVLVVSAVGIPNKEVTVGSGANVTISLSRQSTSLAEVVVTTALGVRRQARELGYSTATISSGDLNQAKPVNPVTGLAGKVSGLQVQISDNSVNPTVRVTLRGNRSILGNNQALVVVDGIQVDNAFLARINPNDIETFNVLKGAGASALYGSNAANGVLVVTTKRGARGTPRITFSSTAQMERISYLPKLQDRFGSYGGENYGSLLAVHFPNDPVKEYYPYENQSYGPEYNGQLVPLGGPARFYRPDGTFFDSTRMVPYAPIKNGKLNFFDKGITLQNNVSFSTGDATSSLYLSYQNVSVKGTVPKDKSQRNIFRVNGMKEYGKFRADYNISYAIENIDQIGTSSNYDNGGYPLYWEVLNQPQHADLRYFRDWQNDPFSSPSYYYNAYYGNPWWYIDNNRDVSKNNNFIGNLKLSYKITDWLNASYTVGYSRNDYTFKNTRAGVTFDPYAITDPWEAGMIASSVKLLQPALTDILANTSRISGDALLTATKGFGDFSVKAIVGNSIYKRQSQYQYDNTNSLVVPGLYNINFRQGEPNVDQQFFSEGLIGVFGDLTLGYKNYLFLHGTGRNDWNSKLAASNRSFFYPGADLSFVFTDALPVLKNKVLSYGKLRVSYTKVGQVSVGPYSLNNVVLSGPGFPFGAQAGFSISNNFANPGLKPEFTTEKEIGMELSFLQSRVNFQVAYFDTKTTNQTIPSQISSATGFTSATINLGSMTNKGVELDLKLTPLLNLGPVRWDVGANFAYIKNTVGTDLGGEISLGNNVYATPGFAYPNLKVSDWERDSASGKVIVSANTGFPKKAGPLRGFGTTVAPYKAGITTSFSYAGFTLNAVADAQFGGVIFNSVGQSLMFTGIDAYSAQSGRQPFVIPNTVVLSNGKYVPNTNVSTIDANWTFWANTWNKAGSPFVNSSDYWKIREISLTYSFPKRWIEGLKVVQNASFTLSGRNLFMFRPKDNVWTDPEFSTGLVNGLAAGFSSGNLNNAVGTTDYYQTPPTRIFGATLNVTF